MKMNWRAIMLCLVVASFSQNAWSMCVSMGGADRVCTPGQDLQGRLTKAISTFFAERGDDLQALDQAAFRDIATVAVLPIEGTTEIGMLIDGRLIPITTEALLEKESLVADGQDLVDLKSVWWRHLETPKEYVKAISTAKISRELVVATALAALRDAAVNARAKDDQSKAAEKINGLTAPRW